jgi:hypothetical protein
MDGPPNVYRRLGDATIIAQKKRLLLLGAALKNPWMFFSGPTK